MNVASTPMVCADSQYSRRKWNDLLSGLIKVYLLILPYLPVEDCFCLFGLIGVDFLLFYIPTNEPGTYKLSEKLSSWQKWPAHLSSLCSHQLGNRDHVSWKNVSNIYSYCPFNRLCTKFRKFCRSCRAHSDRLISPYPTGTQDFE